MFVIAKLVGLFASWGLPEPVRKAAAWATLVVAVIGLMWAAKAAYDASIVNEHEDMKAIESIDARDAAADQRALDAILNKTQAQEMRDAIQSVDPADAQRRLDCLRLERIGSIPEPCRRFSRD